MKNKNQFLILLLTFMLIIFAFIFPEIKAATSIYNYEVIEDLSNDENFNIDDYPDVKNDYSIQIISIAESINNELFIYCYQPSHKSKDLRALKVSMSNEFREGHEAKNLKIYDLDLVSADGVFDKYKVANYIVSNSTERYYNFVCLYREYDSSIDASPDSTITNAVGLEIGKQFCIYDENGETVIEMEQFNTMEIEVKLTDFLTFENGWTMGNLTGDWESLYSFFIVFDVEDYIVKKIYDADLTFKNRSVVYDYDSGKSLSGTYTYSDWEDKYITLSNTDFVLFDGKGLFSRDYSWNRIESSIIYYNNLNDQGVNFSDETKKALLTSQWVFAFYESEYIVETSSSVNRDVIHKEYEEIQDIAILRIHFKDILGLTYNLGVIGDITSPDDNPGGEGGPNFDDFFRLIGIILLLLFIIIFKDLFLIIFKVFIFIVKLPFKLFDKVNKNKEKGDKK